jgi:hypothetical protein
MKKANAPFVNELRINAPRPIDPPTIGGKREAPPISGQQVRAAGNIQAQFGNSLNTKPTRRR